MRGNRRVRGADAYTQHMTTSPYAVNVATLINRPGTMQEMQLSITVPERIGEGMIYFDTGAELEVELRLESLVDGVLATADVSGVLTGQCSRCLQDIEQPWSGNITELYTFENEEGTEYVVQQDLLDLEGPIRDAVVLDLPFQPLCEPGCLGLDPETGEKLTEPLPEPEDIIDPRWEQLKGLLESSDSVPSEQREDRA
ncbi:Ribosomal protein L32p-like protein [Gulosibacter molinativorax]|nr:Ribosomal protein L32p-like protein [Gulosibacter molinativorax]